MKILLCSTCSTADYPNDRAVLAATFRGADLPSEVEIVAVDCLGGCDSPASIGFQAKDMATYVFSGVDVQSDADDIVAAYQTYLRSKDGWIENAQSCGRLRHLLRARIPALKTKT